MNRLLSHLVVVIALTLSACSWPVSGPFARLQTGPTETFTIDEPLPAGAATTDVTLAMAPGTTTLALAGGANGLAEGAVTYNVTEWKPSRTASAGTLQIAQRAPGRAIDGPSAAINRWDLKLGDSVKNVHVECPAGAVTLTLAASLPDAVNMTVTAGAANVRIVVPAGVAASVAVSGGPKQVVTEGAWTGNGRVYTTHGTGTTWTIAVELGVGTVTLVGT